MTSIENYRDWVRLVEEYTLHENFVSALLTWGKSLAKNRDFWKYQQISLGEKSPYQVILGIYNKWIGLASEKKQAYSAHPPLGELILPLELAMGALEKILFPEHKVEPNQLLKEIVSSGWYQNGKKHNHSKLQFRRLRIELLKFLREPKKNKKKKRWFPPGPLGKHI